SAIVLTPAGIVVLNRDRYIAFPRSRVIGVHPGRADASPALLLEPAGGEAIVTLPPGLEDPRGKTTEAIEAWIGDRPTTEPALPPPGRIAADEFDRALRGEGAPGTTVIPRGRGWLKEGPYGALLVAIALGERIVRLPEGASVGPLGYAALALSVALPLAWLLPRLRRARAAKGVAAVLAPDELLVRHPDGFARIPWRKVSAIELSQRSAWSTLGGYRKLRTVHVLREHGAAVALPEDVLGVDPGALASLMEAYSSGAIATGAAADRPPRPPLP
ncbi:MAG: hypothetical protein H5U40_10950, partial [Polyangiaceae bacterium]|nr:hypothetical protein [Polyangiaceae bacterium]